MASKPPPQPSFLDQLFPKLVFKIFGEKAEEYNAFTKANKKLQDEIDLHKAQGAVQGGVKAMFHNRYNGIVHMGNLLQPCLEGFQWASYLALRRRVDLESDVGRGMNAWVESLMTLPSFSIEGAKKVVVTAAAVKRGDSHLVKDKATELAWHRTQELGVSIAGSVAVTGLLRTVGKAARTETIRQVARYSKGGWQIAGVFGVMFGLAKINEAFNHPELAVFSKDLRKSRDEFNRSIVPTSDQFVVNLKELFK